MFESIGWVELLVLIVVGLFILGPERLPSAAAWLGRTVRQVREYATGARQRLNSELGPDLEEWRKPLQELSQLRGMNPSSMVTRHLLDNDPLAAVPPAAGSASAMSPRLTASSLQPGERPPFDPDTT